VAMIDRRVSQEQPCDVILGIAPVGMVAVNITRHTVE